MFQFLFDKSSLIIAIIILCLCSHSDVVFSEENEITKQVANNILSQHIKFGYTCFTYKMNKKYAHLTDPLLDENIITYDERKNMKLTNKGRKYPSVISKKGICFVTGKRDVARIVKIDENKANKNIKLIHFIYNYEPTEIGYLVEGKTEKENKGRAEVVYNVFTGNFIFKGFEYCLNDSEEWKRPTWAYEKNGEKIVQLGIK